MRPGFWQVIICVLVIVLIFGAKKIPERARSLGKAGGEFKKGLKEGEKAYKEGLAESSETADDQAPALEEAKEPVKA